MCREDRVKAANLVWKNRVPGLLWFLPTGKLHFISWLSPYRHCISCTKWTPLRDSCIATLNIIASHSLHPENFGKLFFQTIEASAEKSKALLLVNRNWFADQCCWSVMCMWSWCIITSIKSPFWRKRLVIFTLGHRTCGDTIYQLTCHLLCFSATCNRI